MPRFTKWMIIMILAFFPIYAGAFTVVIDAGHGGRDPGCKGEKTAEKDVTLDVARMVRDLIQNEYGKNVKVVMTRDDDTFISLQQRADIANANKADLFISIHVNSVDNSNPRRKIVEGAQVYVLSDTKASGKASSMKRNTDISGTSDKDKKTGGKPEEIGYSMASTGAAKLSTEFAGYVMKRLCSTAGRSDKGIRQAGFQVLWSTAMPAVLVELDYMCNPEQEKFLASEKGQKSCARAIFEAFGDYYAKYAPPAKNTKDTKDTKGNKNKKNNKNKKDKKTPDKKTADKRTTGKNNKGANSTKGNTNTAKSGGNTTKTNSKPRN